MTVKAIQTSYAGCRFRSRTEARWAVLFDALGIKWEYEREGFELPGGKYLPDFWIPAFEAWVEIKGGEPSKREIKLAGELARSTGQLVLIVCGIPEAEEPQIIFFRPGKTPVWGAYLASRGNALTKIVVKGRKTLWLEPHRREEDRAAIPTELLKAAINKARSARFEHGEKP